MLGKLFLLSVVYLSTVQFQVRGDDKYLNEALDKVSTIVYRTRREIRDFNDLYRYETKERSLESTRHLEEANKNEEEFCTFLEKLVNFIRDETKGKPESLLKCVQEVTSATLKELKKVTRQFKVTLVAEELQLQQKNANMKNWNALEDMMDYEGMNFEKRVKSAKDNTEIDKTVNYYGYWQVVTRYSFKNIAKELKLRIKYYDEHVEQHLRHYNNTFKSLRSESVEGMLRCMETVEAISVKSAFLKLISTH